MPALDPLFAQWLQADGLWLVAEDAPLRAIWGETGLTTQRMTTIATTPEAEAEAARQLAFLGPVSAIDDHLLLGEWRERRGETVTLTIDRLGYEHGAEVLVLGAQDDLASGTSRVTVLKRL